MKQESRLPLVNVTCLYRVGGANERPGITGIAHYVEHMAFRSTENVSKSDITGSIERIGGRWNGYTWIDQTLYAATVPGWALDTVLHIEAERMSRARFEPMAFERERTSVVSELQGYENDPASLLWDLTVATSFQIHPYRYNVIGWLTDVLSIQRDEAYRFYKDFYGPNNAVLVVVGDVEAGDVREKIDLHFGAIQPSPRSAAIRVSEPPQKGQKRVELRHPGSQKNLLLLYRAPRATDPDFPLLLVLDGILAGGRGLVFGSQPALPSSLLHKVVESGGGSSVSTSITPSRDPYVYGISIAASSGVDPERLEGSVQGLLDRLGAEGPSDMEISRAQQRIRAQTAYELDTLAEIAHRLAYFEALDSWELAESIRTATDQVTPADVRSYVRRYMQPSQRTLGLHLPGAIGPEPEMVIGKLDLPEPVVAAPSPVPESALRPLQAPALRTARQVLPNGVVVRVASRQGDSASLYVRLAFGSELDPPGKEGLALLAARTVLGDPKLTSRLAELGAQWWSSTDSTIASTGRELIDLRVRFLPDDLNAVVEAVSEALKQRQWRTEETERARSQLIDELAAVSTDATWLAEANAIEMIDALWRPPGGTISSLAAINSKDVNALLSKALVGGSVTVGLACPGASEILLATLSDALGRLPPGKVSLPSQRSSRAAETEVKLVATEGKTRAEIVAALPGIGRDHPDYLPLQLVTYVLGETGYAGRLGEALVDTGLTYSVYAVPHFGRRAGPLLITTSAAPANLEETLSRIRETVRALSAEGIEEWEWREARAFRVGRLMLGVDSVDRLALALVDSEYHGRDLLDFQAQSERILGLTREQLNEVARRYLRPELLRVSVAGSIQ